MALTKFIKDMSIISALDDEPNDIGGLTAAELKEKFDEGGLAVKSYINENMVPQINSLITETETISEKLTIYARLVVGTSASGITSSECDYLCDGVNDQEEINAAIAALPANGGEIVILDGTYNITAKINVNKSNVSIRGNGDATVLKRMWNSGRSEGVITLTSVSGCKIKNLQIDGNKTTHTSLENEGIYLHSSDNNTIMGNVCINNSSYGIYLKSSNINVIRNNFCNADTYGGVYLYAGYGNIITSNICDSNGLYYGIYLFYGGYNTIAGNSCNNNGGGIYLKTSTNNAVAGNVCNDNDLEGVYLDSGSSNTITGNTCSNNGVGVAFGSCKNNAINGNACNDNNTAIRLEDSHSNTISGNSCIRGGGKETDYSEDQYTIKFVYTNNNNIISSNNCAGKDVVLGDGTGNKLLSAILDGKVDRTTTVNGHALSDDITVTKSDVGLGDCDNTSDVDKPVSTAQQAELDGKVDRTTTVNGHALSDDITVTKSDVGLGDCDNTSDVDKPVSTAQQAELDGKVDRTTTVNGHALSDDITVTKSDVGLGDCDNTSDVDKPVSTAQQAELDGKVDRTTTVNGHALSDDITVTKSDVGLGDCDNTSDVDKPVSTAQQAELDKKVDKTSVVNDLTTGGATKALSAEQGKALNASISELATDVSAFTANKYNLFDKSKIVSGKYIDIDGTERANAAYGYYTMPVVPGTYYSVVGNGFSGFAAPIVFFDSNGVYVTNITGVIVKKLWNSEKTKYAFAIPSGAAFMKINFTLAAVDSTIIFQDGSKLHDSSTFNDTLYGKYIVKKTDTPFIANVLEGISTKSFLNYGYIKFDGSFASSSAFWSSPIIPVAAGEIYRLENWLNTGVALSTMNSRGIYLDSNFCFVSAVPRINSYTPEYTIPSGVCYVTFVFDTTLVSSFAVKRIYSPTEKMQIRKNSIYPPLPETETNGWSGKKWASFGDSITYREAWQPSVVSAFSLIHTNCGIGSTALAGTGSNAFWQDVRLDAVKAADPDMVTILGGANDLVDPNITIGASAEFAKALAEKDKNTFIGAYSYIIETLLTWKPTLRIVILGTTWAYMNGADYSATLTYTDYSDASKLVAQHYGLPFVDLHGESGFNQFTVEDSPYNIYSDDHIHPNALGAKRIAELVISKLQSVNPIV